MEPSSNSQADNESGKFLKNIGNKLADEDESSNMKNSSLKELEGLNEAKIGNDVKEKIILKEKDIEMLKNEIAITYDEAKHLLIKHHGSYQKVIESFLNDFRFSA